MTVRYIAIAYDNATAAEGEPFDLFNNLLNELNNAHIKSNMVEYGDPRTMAEEAATLGDGLNDEEEPA